MKGEDIEIIISADPEAVKKVSEQLSVLHGFYVSPGQIDQTVQGFSQPIAQRFTEIEWNIASMRTESLLQKTIKRIKSWTLSKFAKRRN